MCELGLILTGVGMVTSFIGSQQEASAQRQAGEYNQQVQNNNAIVARQQAAAALEKGDKEAALSAIETRKQAGLALATSAGNGIAVSSGSVLDIQGDIFSQGQRNVAEIRANAAREATGFNRQASNFVGAGDLAAFSADSAAAQTSIGGFSTLATSGGQVASKWQAYNTTTEAAGGNFLPGFTAQKRTFESTGVF